MRKFIKSEGKTNKTNKRQSFSENILKITRYSIKYFIQILPFISFL
jgi:hypothetical protein